MNGRRSLWRNVVSEIGLITAILALTNTLFLIYVNAIQKHANPYLGILAWIVAPAVLLGGVMIFLVGLVLERRRRRRMAPDEVPEYPRLDLNTPSARALLVGSILAIVAYVTASVIGTYQAYHYTDSDAFCGTLCHQVMHPEYTAYKESPHARVGCVNCHVGAGATWYVRSKLSGAYQVYATLTDKYPRPIPTPVENLRPAQETCEQCHWPQKFWGAQLKVFDHYQYDEASTPVETQMLIKVGGGTAIGGLTSGIHWHMNIANEVTYFATDAHRQKIPWVRIKDREGRVTEYLAEDAKMTPAQIAAAPKRRMDCVDCHNRPTHIYLSPDRAVDQAISAGRLDRSLPYLKQQAVAVLTKDFATTPAALKSIASDFPAYYRTTYPAVYGAKRKAIDRASAALQEVFSTIRFPEMRVDWRTHPNNVGHMFSMGCFRCHDDQHVSSDGKRISKDCQICHTMLSGTKTAAEFQHPVDLGDLRGVTCADCHTGSGM